MYRKILFLITVFLLVPLAASHAQERGKASYYAKNLHGRKMASGMTYHRDSLTCAHPSLPFGTKLKVKNLKNGKEVVVSVQDRGPYSRDRIIDLSHSAAKQLGMLNHGVTIVEVSSYRGPGIQVPFVAVDSIPFIDFHKAAVDMDKESQEELFPANELMTLITQTAEEEAEESPASSDEKVQGNSQKALPEKKKGTAR